jgi:hypothetical protein
VRRAQTLAATPWQDYKSFVDIGAAQGRVPVTIARAHNRLSGGGYDFMSAADDEKMHDDPWRIDTVLGPTGSLRFKALIRRPRP